MRINEIFLFVSALSITFGFSQNRTEWSIVPQLDPRQKPSEEVLMKDTRAKAIDHVLKSSVEKKLLGSDNLTTTTTENSLRGKRSDDLESSSESEGDFIIDLISEAKSESGGNQEEKPFAKKSSGYCPSNVILILIDGLDRAEQSLRMDLENRELFPVQGVLQSCATNSSPFRLTRSAECDCEGQLKTNIASLLTWARLEKKKSTSTLYEMLPVYSSRMEMETKSFADPRVRRIDPQLHESWQLNKAPKSRLARSSAPPNLFIKEEQPEAEQLDSRDHEEIMWHVSDVLSRLREAFFRSLMSGGADSPFEPSFLRRANFRDLASGTIEELASMSNGMGYVMLATTGPAEIPEVVGLALRYSSQHNTLAVVMSSCPRSNSGDVAYFARGPGSAQLAAAKPADLDGLFEAVRVIVSASACHGPADDEAGRAVESDDHPAMFDFAQPLLLLRPEPEAMPRVRLARNHRAEHLHEIFNELEKTRQIKKLEDPNADSVKMTDKRSNGTLESEDLGVRIGDFTNSQEIPAPTTIIYVTVLTISITYTLKY